MCIRDRLNAAVSTSVTLEKLTSNADSLFVNLALSSNSLFTVSTTIGPATLHVFVCCVIDDNVTFSIYAIALNAKRRPIYFFQPAFYLNYQCHFDESLAKIGCDN